MGQIVPINGFNSKHKLVISREIFAELFPLDEQFTKFA
jgi:hypothetical protein